MDTMDDPQLRRIWKSPGQEKTVESYLTGGQSYVGFYRSLVQVRTTFVPQSYLKYLDLST